MPDITRPYVTRTAKELQAGDVVFDGGLLYTVTYIRKNPVGDVWIEYRLSDPCLAERPYIQFVEHPDSTFRVYPS